MKDAYHPAFRFQGKTYNYDELWDVAYSLVKEGDSFERSLGDFILDWVSDREYLVQRTSGSTGAPKEIRLQKRHLVHSARATGSFLGLGPGTRALDCLPLAAISGKMMWIRAMVLGWDITGIPAVSDPLREVSGTFDVAAMVPLQVQKSLPWLSRIGTLLIGGAPISPEQLAQLPVSHTGLWQTYGMTETGSHVALRRLSPVPKGVNPESILPPYQALNGVQLELDERGCLRIDAPGWLDAPLQTNDLVSLESPTTFRWLGRQDLVVNSGGVKLLLDDLEQRMSSHISERFILAGVPDPKLGERLILVVESDGLPFELLAHLQASTEFSKYECPRELFHVPRFVETPTGKIDRLQTLSLINY
jgi:O-succinylbenzoic acid--CoA ligase